MAVYLIVSIPLLEHDRFLKKLDPGSREHEMMVNAVIERRRIGSRFEPSANLLCTENDAFMFLDLAKKLHPAAAPHIAKSIEVATRK